MGDFVASKKRDEVPYQKAVGGKAMKLRKMASMLLTVCMAVSMVTFLAATKADQLTPQESATRLNNALEKVIQSVETSGAAEDLSSAEQMTAAGWLGIFATVYNATEAALTDAAFAAETGNAEKRMEEYKVNAYSKATPEYYIYGEDNDKSDEGVYSGYKTSYLRALNRLHTISYQSNEKKQDFDERFASLDFVNGRNNLFMQFSMFNGRDVSTDENLYMVVRVMVGENDLYGSVAELTENELRMKQLVSTYPNYQEFLLANSDTFVFDGQTLTMKQKAKKDWKFLDALGDSILDTIPSHDAKDNAA